MAMLAIAGYAIAGPGNACATGPNSLTIDEVKLPKNGEAYIEIVSDFTDPFCGLELKLDLPECADYVVNSDGTAKAYLGFTGTDIALMTGTPSETNTQVVYLLHSTQNTDLPKNSLIAKIKIKATESAVVGQTYQARFLYADAPLHLGFSNIKDYEFGELPFNITIVEEGQGEVVLNELSQLAPEAVERTNVKVKRTIKANEWSTICLPFAMNEEQTKSVFGNDVELGNFTGYEVSKDNDGITGIKVKFADATEIEANHPYIIKVSEPVSEFTLSNVKIEPTDEPVVATVKRTRKNWSEFIGTYVAGTVVPEFCLFLNDNNFWYSTGKTKMKGFRGYFDFVDVLTDIEDASSKFSFEMNGNETTGINRLFGEGMVEGAVYDIQGRKVADSLSDSKNIKKGFYIINGQKRIIK